jgi:hypothetical protein
MKHYLEVVRERFQEESMEKYRLTGSSEDVTIRNYSLFNDADIIKELK